MGITSQSTGSNILNDMFKIERASPNDKIIAFAGNPNVGKSTVFNSLTGLNQHTGNWPGKTVTNAQGKYNYKESTFILVDLPGTYSLSSSSAEEEVARDFICFGNADATLIITDATCLERNLNLVLQTIQMTDKVVVCVNLIDEAARKKITIDFDELSRLLGVPVIATNARDKKGFAELMAALDDISNESKVTNKIKITYDKNVEDVINIIQPVVKELVFEKVDSRWLSLKIIEEDESISETLTKYLGFNIYENELFISKLNIAKEYLKEKEISNNDLRDSLVSSILHKAEEISNNVVVYENKTYNDFDRKVDKIITSRLIGIPVMIGLLGVILWLTISGANYPSEVLVKFFFWVEGILTEFLYSIGTPQWLHGLMVLGVYRTLAWVVAVMLPPMAIFFPLFTLLEDLGYLPRVAFNLDNFFKKACAHGKQALTMCMGFGCNAAGVIGCRIIDSPRERLIAIITNNFVPCNGRFPTLIVISTIFFAGIALGPLQSLVCTLILTSVIVFGVLMTLLISRLLSKTLLKGLPSSFTLELPPYRRPQIGKIIVRSIFDRTIFVLGRAMAVAAPAGLIIWIMANVQIYDISILAYCAGFLNPFASLIGLDGYILMAFILGFPANEIVFPIIIMSYMATGSLVQLNDLSQLREILVSHGWTWLTAVCVMLFSLMHFPCATTCWTIRKETQSLKWTMIAFIVPTVIGILICFTFANAVRLFELI
ncbi:MAG TPA: ferrous iron transport protein B [Clostridiales bacterium]|nr:MAG: ferrous iron transport protein B [Clostridiales bacterium GWD2_32_19]HCC08221.1 ferrous iron transport protein B [Clostridiales bacterium]